MKAVFSPVKGVSSRPYRAKLSCFVIEDVLKVKNKHEDTKARRRIALMNNTFCLRVFVFNLPYCQRGVKTTENYDGNCKSATLYPLNPPLGGLPRSVHKRAVKG
jgi:hypothetical protein